jgi:hypothetical protein
MLIAIVVTQEWALRKAHELNDVQTLVENNSELRRSIDLRVVVSRNVTV